MDSITFEWDGDRFELVNDTDAWTIGETRAVERALGVHIEDMGMVDQTTATLAVSIKRQRPEFRLADVEKLPMELVGTVVEKAREAARKAAQAAPPAEADAEPVDPASAA